MKPELRKIKASDGAIGLNLGDVKEVCDFIFSNNENKKDLLKAKSEESYSIDFKFFYLHYLVNKYDRQIKPLKMESARVNHVESLKKQMNKAHLISIKRGKNLPLREEDFEKTMKVLEELLGNNHRKKEKEAPKAQNSIHQDAVNKLEQKRDL